MVSTHTLLRWTKSNPIDRRNSKRSMPMRIRTHVNINLVKNAIEQTDGQLSIRGLAKKLEMNYTSLWKIVRKDLKLYPYKFQKAQELTNAHKIRRKLLCLKMLDVISGDPDFFKRIIFSDETAVLAVPPANCQNERVLSESQQHHYRATRRHPLRVNAICAVNFHLGVIGPYYFADDTPIDGEKYKEMLRVNILPALISKMPVRDTRSRPDARAAHLSKNFVWQQDNAPVHTMHDNIEFVSDHFERVISKRCFLEWPPNSPDLSPLDYWLWGDIKRACKPMNSRDDMRTQFSAITSDQTLEKVQRAINQFPLRLKLCIQQEGDRFESILSRGSRQQRLQ